MAIVFSCVVPHPPLIVPGIGSDKEKEVVKKTIEAMENVSDALALAKPESALIVSPHSYYIDSMSMGIYLGTASKGNLHEWGTRVPGQHFENDMEFVELIRKEAQDSKIPLKSIGGKAYNLDHGVLVPIYFLSSSLKGIPLVPLTFSYLPLKTHFEFGKAISRAAEKLGKRVALIASGDLSHYLKGSHYGYHPEGAIFEQQLEKALTGLDSNAILNMDPEIVEQAGECGLRSVVIMMGAIEGLDIVPRIFSHEGPFGVGYLVASFQVK